MAKKKPYRFALYILARGFAGIVCILPRSFAQFVAKWVGRLTFVLVSRQRDKALAHLKIAFGQEKTDKEIKLIARGVFENLTQTAVEILQFSKLNQRKVQELVDFGDVLEAYRSLLKEGKGVIAVTAHIGNWELLAGSITSMGFEGGVIARKIYYEPYNRWIVGLRNVLGVTTYYRDNASRDILKVLGSNQIIGILPDQDIDSLKGIFVNFFNKPAYTPVAPVRLALSSKAPILPNFLIRKPDGRYKFVVGDVIRPVVKTNRDEAVFEGTRLWMESFEKVIRQYPEQWAWMHNRWKTQPKENASFQGSSVENEKVNA